MVCFLHCELKENVTFGQSGNIQNEYILVRILVVVSKFEEAKLGGHDDWCKGTPEGLQWLRMPAMFVPFLINDETFQVRT